MPSVIEAYLDIETTGLSPNYSQITVVGIHLCNGDASELIQLVADDITDESILAALKDVGIIYTYNGSRFDLPFIHDRLGLNLAAMFRHCDLMYRCWQYNLYGGFKSVEKQLGISRELTEINGYEAVRLWWNYVNNYDQNSLKTLLAYNREDVVNLKALKERLFGSNE